VQKNDLLFGFIIGFVLCLVVSAAGYFIWRNQSGGDLDRLAGEYRASQQRADEQIKGLERVIGEQRERINDIEASNQRLEVNIRDARELCEQAIGGSGKAADDIRSAIELSKTLTTALKDIDRILSGRRSGGDSGDGHNNMADL
jgi:phage shock protein A